MPLKPAPLKTALSDTYPNPSNATMRAGMAALWDWATSLLGTSGDPADARTALGAVALSGDTMTGLLTFKAGANIASASTVNLSTATGNGVHITGTTTITNFTMTAGQLEWVVFDGALTLTHHATNNNLPGAANITTAAGDRALYHYDGTTAYCLSYVRAATPTATVAQLNATGRVLQVKFYTNSGTTTSSTSYVSAQGAQFNFTPVSTNSTIIALYTFDAMQGYLSATNYSVGYNIYEATAASYYGDEEFLYSFTGGGGVVSRIPAAHSAAITNNAALTSRGFQLRHFVSDASGSASTRNIHCTIIEVQN